MPFSLTLPLLDIFVQRERDSIGAFVRLDRRPALGTGSFDLEVGLGRVRMIASHSARMRRWG